jgi:hypothetical protein
MTQTTEIVQSCIACATHTNLLATFATIIVGAVVAIRFERRKLALARAPRPHNGRPQH